MANRLYNEPLIWRAAYIGRRLYGEAAYTGNRLYGEPLIQGAASACIVCEAFPV